MYSFINSNQILRGFLKCTKFTKHITQPKIYALACNATGHVIPIFAFRVIVVQKLKKRDVMLHKEGLFNGFKMKFSRGENKGVTLVTASECPMYSIQS